MPTFAEQVIDEVCRNVGSFDEQARSALLSNTDAISTLSILHRVAGHKEQVRNPSAFVVKSVRSGRERGPSGPAELENAILRLGESGFIDESAGDLMRRSYLQDVSAALATFLGLDVSSVRNPSAYLTRSVVNARSGDNKWSGPPAQSPPGPRGGSNGGPAYSVPPSAPPPAAHYGSMPSGKTGSNLRARWAPSLDAKALHALTEVGAVAANEVLQELEKQGSSVRNPSGYVQRACENRLRDAGLIPSGPSMPPKPPRATLPPPPVPAPVHAPARRQSGLSPLMAKYGSSLDADATEALRKLSPDGAHTILSNLDSKSGSIRNVSAYVVRSVFNFLKEQGDQGGSYESTAGYEDRGHYGYSYDTNSTDSRAYSGYGGSDSGKRYGHSYDPFEGLDDRARQTLSDLPSEVSESILGELRNMGRSVHNPSAYVQKAAANARKEEGQSQSSWGEKKAIGAIGSFKKQSDYDYDRGSPAQDPLEELLEPWRSTLDSNALRQLESVGLEAAEHILSELESKGDQVRNPSAYISKSTSNFKHTGQLGARGGEHNGDRQEREEEKLKRDFDEEVSSLPYSLDDKAMEALEEVGHQGAMSILRNLQDAGDKVKNPNAYIMRACANEKRPDAKRRRHN
mmetsp:Transcript_83012/g.173803  ORF Transcript_83012/g.173803 Transcript_83012/m.173803 type:complete len:629 (-) Transcript_83012:163-2049(-)